MKKLLTFFLTLLSLGPIYPILANEYLVKYLHQERSLIEWEKIDLVDWFDIRVWKKEQKFKDDFPDWEAVKRDVLLNELIGMVLECVGECRLYRGDSHNKLRLFSKLKEGDEVKTIGESYMWIYLIDGTLVRLSPLSSISLQEINIGQNEIFIHTRINEGNVLWLSRDKYLVEEHEEWETDAIFIPSVFFEANPPQKKFNVGEDNLISFLLENPIKDQYKRLNQLIKENNKVMRNKRPTYSFLSMGNGTMFGKNLRADFYVLTEKSYIRNRSFKFYNPKKDPPNETQFFYRGFDNTEVFSIENDVWYEVNFDGSNIQQVDESDEVNKNFRLGELVTKRIPTIMIARELFLKKYSYFMFKLYLEKVSLAGQYGYRLWESIDKNTHDLKRRLEFLKEYTRRTETSSLRTLTKLRKRILARGDKIEKLEIGHIFYRRALMYYSTYQTTREYFHIDPNAINSTKRPFWKLIHTHKFANYY